MTTTTTTTHFFQPIRSFLRKISYIGTHNITDDRLRRKVILSNQLSVSAAAFVFSVGLRLSFTVGAAPLPGYAFITFAYCFVLLLNKWGHHNASRLYLNILPTINLLIVSGITSDDYSVSLKFAYMSILAVPLVFFDLHEKKLLTFGILWVIAMFYLTDIVNPYIPMVTSADSSRLDNLRTMNVNAFLSFGMFVIAFLYLQRLNLKAENKIFALYQETNAQKDALAEKNKTIMESLDYARYIQKAVLSKPEVLESFCQDYFLLFKPKDVVSGDFWMFKSLDRRLVIAVADGTGHGVPGAFLSMLGISFLTEIIRKTKDATPAQVLFELRSQIKTALHQQDFSSELHDGMDMALVFFDPETNQLEYAGARRPLFLIKAQSPDQIIEYKPDRMPIGIYETETTFTNHTIAVNQGDTIYLFTDGYEDQLGGSVDSRFKSKRFKDTLLSLQSLSLSRQRSRLESIQQDWQGNNDQTDDILVVGLKI